jgi:integration host factor subunit alpha
MGKTKSDLAEAVYARQPDLTKKDAADLVDAVLDALKDAFQSGETVKVQGFGKFVVREKSERAGRNPKTGDVIAITRRRVLTFKPSAVLKAALNGNGK